MKLRFRKPSRRTLIEIGLVAVVAYFGFYIFLRWDGEIVRHENRGAGIGVTIRARHDPWDDIALSMAEGVPRFGWALGLMVRIRQSRVEAWNILYFPLLNGEELCWNLAPQS